MDAFKEQFWGTIYYCLLKQMAYVLSFRNAKTVDAYVNRSVLENQAFYT